MKFNRMTGLVATGLLLVGCGSQMTVGQQATDPRDPSRVFSLLNLEPCPPEPCTFCQAVGAGVVFTGGTSSASFQFNVVEGATGNQVNATHTNLPTSNVSYASDTENIVACLTEDGRDIVRVEGTATATDAVTSTQVTGTFTLVTSVVAGTSAALPAVSYSFVGTGNPAFNFSFDSNSVSVAFQFITVDTDTPCVEPQ